MTGLDDIDLGTLLQLETDLTERKLDGFLEFVREHFGLAGAAYQCPVRGWRSIADPFHALPCNGGREDPRGFTIQVRGAGNQVEALFSVASREQDTRWRARRNELLKELTCVAHYVHQRAHELHSDEPSIDLNALTDREVEALEGAAEGKTIDEIAITLRISATTVKAHLDSARFKLQALNHVHAVAKAIRSGLIQ